MVDALASGGCQLQQKYRILSSLLWRTQGSRGRRTFLWSKHSLWKENLKTRLTRPQQDRKFFLTNAVSLEKSERVLYANSSNSIFVNLSYWTLSRMRNHKIATPATSPNGEVNYIKSILWRFYCHPEFTHISLTCGERKGAEGGGLFFGASIACEKKIRRPV